MLVVKDTKLILSVNLEMVHHKMFSFDILYIRESIINIVASARR